MVEVKEKLYIDAKRFFKSITESVAYDIRESTGKNMRSNQIHKGFSYKKVMRNKLKRKGDVRITILEYDPPHVYRAEFVSAMGVNTVSYEVEELEDGRIGVIYKEAYHSDVKANNLNFKLVSFLYKRKAEKKAIRLLRAIETYAQEEQKN